MIFKFYFYIIFIVDKVVSLRGLLIWEEVGVLEENLCV